MESASLQLQVNSLKQSFNQAQTQLLASLPPSQQLNSLLQMDTLLGFDFLGDESDVATEESRLDLLKQMHAAAANLAELDAKSLEVDVCLQQKNWQKAATLIAEVRCGVESMAYLGDQPLLVQLERKLRLDEEVLLPFTEPEPKKTDLHPTLNRELLGFEAETLERVRRLILNEGQTCVSVAEHLPEHWKHQTLMVSHCAFEIVQLVYELISKHPFETANLEESLALIRLCRSGVLLFKALKQTQLSRFIEPKAAAIFYNDAIYISAFLKNIGAAIQVPHFVKPYLYFTDMIPGLKAQGEKVFSEQLAQHKGKIFECLAEVQLSDIADSYNECEDGLKRALSYLNWLTSEVQEVMNPETLTSFIDKLEAIIVNTLKAEITRLKDISASEAESIRRLLEIASVEQLALSSDTQRQRIEVIREFFDADLKQIVMMNSANKFENVFDAQQLPELIIALFVDNANRAECLRQLRFK